MARLKHGKVALEEGPSASHQPSTSAFRSAERLGGSQGDARLLQGYTRTAASRLAQVVNQSSNWQGGIVQAGHQEEFCPKHAAIHSGP